MAENNLMADRLAVELRQFRVVGTLFKYIKDSVPPPGPRASLKLSSTFGRWLQVVQHFNPADEEPLYKLLPQQPVNESIRLELQRMLHEDFGVSNEDAQNITNRVIEISADFIEAPPDEALPDVAVRYTENGSSAQISMSRFITKTCPRIRYLARTFGTEQTALVCLRYAHLSEFRGGESGMCVSGLNALREVGRVTYEGFSSPLNCRLLGQEGVSFCSLFEDTDAAFGSLGNFFRINLVDYPGGWSLAPPFVEPVMNETADRVLQILDETEPGRFWFFVTLRHWEDNPGWQRLDQSPRKVARIDFENREFWQQDNYGAIYRPDAKICIFVLGQLPEDVDLVQLRNRIADLDEATVQQDWLQACTVEN